MVVRYQNSQEQRAQGVRGGIGEATSRLLAGVTQGENNSSLLALAVNTLGPGASWGPHKHKNREEIFLILEGEAEVIDNGERQHLNRWDAVLARPGETLAIRNPGQNPLVFLGLVLRMKSPWLTRFQ